MSPDDPTLPARQTGNRAVDAFLTQVAAMPTLRPGGRGRLIFAMDATLSRQPTWDQAMQIQGDMFLETAAIGGLDIQLLFFRGHGECFAGKWAADPATLLRQMSSVSCRGGQTQWRKVLDHAIAETRRTKVHALVMVGDVLEEAPDQILARAGDLALTGVPCFIFQEGHEPQSESLFREIARLTKGAWCRFDPASPAELRALLAGVAVYAAGGRSALLAYEDRGAANLPRLTRAMGS